MSAPAPASPLRLGRRQLLATGAVAGLGLLAGCRRSGPRLLASRGDLPAPWAQVLPAPWRLETRDDPAAVLAALDPERPALVQLSDGWASGLATDTWQPIHDGGLLDRLAPRARAVSRLFGPDGAPRLALPFAVSPWVLLLRNRPDLLRRAPEGWELLLDPSLRGRLVLPASPRVTIALVNGDPARLRRLRAQALAYDDRHGLNLLLGGEAEALVLPRRRVVPLLQRDPRLQALLPQAGSPLSWNLLLRPAGAAPTPPTAWLAKLLDPSLLPDLLAAGWVPPLPHEELARASAGFPPALRALLAPPAGVLERCTDLPPLATAERLALQDLWDRSAPPPDRS
jgi:putative spermidine/putrescine transport system substrate-binding protein